MDQLSWLAWPGVVLILGVAFLFLFRKPIASFLFRATEVSKSGIRAAAAQGQIAEVSSSTAAENLMRSFDSEALLTREEMILGLLRDRGVGGAPDQVKVLARHLAAFQLAY